MSRRLRVFLSLLTLVVLYELTVVGITCTEPHPNWLQVELIAQGVLDGAIAFIFAMSELIYATIVEDR